MHFSFPINRRKTIPLTITVLLLKTKQVAGSVQSRDSSQLKLKSTRISYSDKPSHLGTDGTKARGSAFSICPFRDGPTIWTSVGFTFKNLIKGGYGSGVESSKVGYGQDRIFGLTFGITTKPVGFTSKRFRATRTFSISIPEPTSEGRFLPAVH